jgi:hypothetical protein
MKFDLTFSPAQQRGFAVLLLLLPLTLILASVASWMSSRAEHHKHVALLKREIAEYRAILDTGPAWKQRLAQINHSANLLLDEPQAQAATLDLQNKVTTLISRDGGKVVQSAAQISAPDGNEAARLQDMVGVDATMEALTHILQDLQQQRPLMLVSRLSIRAPDNEPPGTAPILHAELSIDAFLRLPR